MDLLLAPFKKKHPVKTDFSFPSALFPVHWKMHCGLCLGCYNPREWDRRNGPARRGWVNVMSVHSLVRPRVADLVFHLYGKPLHPELFDILAMRKIQREDYELTIKITRTGHVISWDNPELVLTEVATAADEPLPDQRCLLRQRLRGEHSAVLDASKGITYQTSFQVETLTQEIFLHVHDEILADGGKRGLLHNFQPNHRLALAPLGFITAEARARCLLLTTFHTFPDEHTIVKSQTLIEKR